MTNKTYNIKYKKGKTDPSQFIKKLEDNGFIQSDKPNYLFALGGDGNFLDAVHENLENDAIIVPINYGTLGFYSNFKATEEDDVLKRIDTRDYRVEELRLLEIEFNGKKFYSINEVFFMKPTVAQIIDISINDVHFEHFRGTGIIVCTPTGSFGYNKSVGGACMSPDLVGFELSEIAGIDNNHVHNLSSSLILKEKDKVTLSFVYPESQMIAIDGDEMLGEDPCEVTIRLSDKVAKVLTCDKDSLDRVRRSFI